MNYVLSSWVWLEISVMSLGRRLIPQIVSEIAAHPLVQLFAQSDPDVLLHGTYASRICQQYALSAIRLRLLVARQDVCVEDLVHETILPNTDSFQFVVASFLAPVVSDVLGLAIVPVKLGRVPEVSSPSSLIKAAHFTLVLTVEVCNKIGLGQGSN